MFHAPQDITDFKISPISASRHKIPPVVYDIDNTWRLSLSDIILWIRLDL